MQDEDKTKAQLLEELQALRRERDALRARTADGASEEALRQERDKVKQYLDVAGAMFVVVDAEARVTLINRKGAEILGWEPHQILGANWFDTFVPDTEREEARERFAQLMSGDVEPVESFEGAVLTKSGQERIVAWHNALLKDDADNVIGTLSSGADVTERIRLEQDKQQLEAQFQQAQKMEAVGRLATGIAHDFNNLLTVIKGYARMIGEDLVEGSPMRADIQQILDAGQRATNLVGQLLAFSRKQRLEPKVLDLNEVVGNLEPMLHRLIGEDVALKMALADGIGRIRADPHQIEQVLMNLAVNARDAMPAGGQLIIETGRVDWDEEFASKHPGAAAGRHVMLTVTDTGSGMTEQVRDRIFEPFYTTKEQGKGTGLGLATVYGIVMQSHGSIWADSTPGRGSAFRVYLPVVDVSDGDGAQASGTTALDGTETVLVVEDAETVRHLTARILAAAGYRVLSARDGAEALLERERHGDVIDLLLTDVVMPEMSGKELASRLGPTCPAMRVLYMSGYTDDAIVHHGVLDEGIHFIAKPFGVAELLERVRLVLDAD